MLIEYNPHSNLFTTNQPTNILQDLLEDKRSPATRHGYERDLKEFFNFATGQLPTPEIVQQFLNLDEFRAKEIVLTYRRWLYSKNLKSATVNRKLAAIKALVKYAKRVGKSRYDLTDIKSDKVVPYRDTTGLPATQIKQILQSPNTNNFQGKRDYAILRLLWDNALRRSEVVAINIGDLNLSDRTIWIKGKGRQDKERITINQRTVAALKDYLLMRKGSKNDPLFISISSANRGERLADDTIYNLVKHTSAELGIDKPMSPHKIRHSAITHCLDKSDGDIRKVQQFSRHKNVQTVLVYDDNRRDYQGQMTDLMGQDF
ncbi:MAG: tyrosine-type recombinase/integrase [Okeania sp. SIO2C9]|uniref:tyrosine-type recombinase/integrase n=1 Tax=Okeania sp. SIO2C9 TaxID=2607791 RepID=UPI0013C03138|nr:tyrosine-type recombinase/integrase [Okeania sp. SIO2C9]NEQ77952.1 tyrosine-type recombinase/integrase [Okeania sp. SIO2C9]